MLSIKPKDTAVLYARSQHNRLKSTTLLGSIAALLMAAANTVDAADFCEEMKDLITQAHSNFTSGVVEATDAVSPKPLAGADYCTLGRSESGVNSYLCAWNFPYRDADAHDAFIAFNRSLPSCFDDSVAVGEDQAVNHPDTYEQRQYLLDQIAVTVSIKDKSALQQTYVFVGVLGADSD